MGVNEEMSTSRILAYLIYRHWIFHVFLRVIIHFLIQILLKWTHSIKQRSQMINLDFRGCDPFLILWFFPSSICQISRAIWNIYLFLALECILTLKIKTSALIWSKKHGNSLNKTCVHLTGDVIVLVLNLRTSDYFFQTPFSWHICLVLCLCLLRSFSLCSIELVIRHVICMFLMPSDHSCPVELKRLTFKSSQAAKISSNKNWEVVLTLFGFLPDPTLHQKYFLWALYLTFWDINELYKSLEYVPQQLQFIQCW